MATSCLSANERGQHACRGSACVIVVGSDEADVVLNLDSGVEDSNRYARTDRAFERSYQRALVGCGDGQPIHLARYHGIHNLDLPVVVGFIVRPIPQDAHVQIVRRLLDAGVYRNKEQMRDGFGNYADDLFARAAAGGEQCTHPRARDAA